jgi:hypothetical protein
MQTVEFALRAIRPPVSWTAVLGRGAFFTLWASFCLRDVGAYPVVAAISIALGLAIVVLLVRRDTRPQPAGRLRLSSDKLESSAHTPAIALTCSDVRAIEQRGDAIVVRSWRVAPFAIHAQRLDAPLSELRTALESWHRPDPEQSARNARDLKMMTVRVVAVGVAVGLVTVFLPLFLR